MRKVSLRMNEQYKYKTIKKLVDTNGNKKCTALKLKCSVRNINRLIQLYHDEGKIGFIHKNRGKTPASSFTPQMKEQIISNYEKNYFDTNFTHYVEIVKEDFNLSISDTTLHHWLKERYILSPKAHRITKRTLKKQLRKLNDNSPSKKERVQLSERIETIDDRNAHPRRSRCKNAGEMLQMDASSYEWIEDQLWYLHVAIDDASGQIVGAYFDNQETLNGYYQVFRQILLKHGIPHMFYTDKRTVFEYKRKNTLFDDEDTFTQFAYACHQFGVEIKTSSIPQAKGRVERLNQTLQSRLPVELRRSNITSIEQANAYLSTYLTKYNDKFSIPLHTSKNVFEVQPSIREINLKLARLSTRKIDNGHCIKFKNEYYIPINSFQKRQLFKCKTECLMIEALDRNLYASIGEKIYKLEKIATHETHSANFDETPKEVKPKNTYIPPMSHPWKARSFQQFQMKQKHRHDIGANV